jgi:hypothetical protein
VRREVWDYAVGGKNVVGSWFNYRKKDPGGKRSSPLDHLYPTAWDPDWTAEAIDLLTVLTRLVELEPAQADLLARILASERLHADDLRAAGARWPMTSKDRKPRYSFSSLRRVDSPASQGVLDV